MMTSVKERRHRTARSCVLDSMLWLDADLDADSGDDCARMMRILEVEDAALPTGRIQMSLPPPAPAPLQVGDVLVLAHEQVATAEQATGAKHTIRLPTITGAWGSGQHATTRLMLRWLQTAEVLEVLPRSELCDFGHGSGILALAAAALGCTSCIGVDIEPTAVVGARENALASELSARCRFVLPPASFLEKDVDFGARFGDYRTYDDLMDEPAGHFDIVLANILPGPLTQLAPTLLALLKPGGRLAIAGCQEYQVKQLQDVYRAAGLSLEAKLREYVGGKWVLLEGIKSS